MGARAPEFAPWDGQVAAQLGGGEPELGEASRDEREQGVAAADERQRSTKRAGWQPQPRRRADERSAEAGLAAAARSDELVRRWASHVLCTASGGAEASLARAYVRAESRRLDARAVPHVSHHRAAISHVTRARRWEPPHAADVSRTTLLSDDWTEINDEDDGLYV